MEGQKERKIGDINESRRGDVYFKWKKEAWDKTKRGAARRNEPESLDKWRTEIKHEENEKKKEKNATAIKNEKLTAYISWILAQTDLYEKKK